MRIVLFLCVALSVLPQRATAMTEEVAVTAAYVREHPKEWSVTATRKDDGLIHFTVVRTLDEPTYFVACFEMQEGGKPIVKSYTPSFGKKGRNRFYFAIPEDRIAASKFELSESGLGMTVNGKQVDVPSPGGTDYQFRLRDFAPRDTDGSRAPK